VVQPACHFLSTKPEECVVVSFNSYHHTARAEILGKMAAPAQKKKSFFIIILHKTKIVLNQND
jgi:hypothetical protein